MTDTKISALPTSTTPLAGTEIVPLVQGGTTKNVSIANLTAGRSVSASALSTTAGMVDVRATSGIGVRFIETSSGNTNRIQLGTGSGFGYIDATAGTGSTYLSLQAASVEYAKLETSGNLTLNTGNLVQGAAAKGINFTANTPAAGMTSQLLNWYEEGTWTPAFEFATAGDASFTYTTRTGWYTRVGNLVTVQFEVVVSATTVGTGSGNLLLAGLPFISKTGFTQSGVISYASGYTTNMPTTVEVASASAKLVFISQPATAAGTIITNTNVPAGATAMYGAITYMV